MQLYIADYLGDTQHLTTEQHGAYLLILMAMWRAGGKLPMDARKLCRIAKVHPPHWGKIAADILEFFDEHDGFITQKRLSKEHQKAIQKSQLRAEAGRKGGLSKSLKMNNEIDSFATDLLGHSSEARNQKEEDTPTVPKGTERVRKAKGYDPKLVHEFEEMVWKEFPRHPNSRKDPALKKFHDLTPEERAKCIGGVARYSIRFEATTDQKRTVQERLEYVPHLVTWINQKGWQSEYERQG